MVCHSSFDDKYAFVLKLMFAAVENMSAISFIIIADIFFANFKFT